MPDPMIHEADLADGDFCGAVHGMRHHHVRTNPFLPVMALSYNPTPELVRKIIDSGADDLVPKPVSADRLIDRIKLLIEARKPFVVTTDYVGPDRRKASDRAGTVPRVEVPNSLRAKATGTKDTALDQKAMADAIAASAGAAPAKDLKLLPNLTKATQKTFDVKEHTEAIARKISESVRKK